VGSFAVVVRCDVEKGKVDVLRVLTHREYDHDRWKAEL
jgi:hypothetical protein